MKNLISLKNLRIKLTDYTKRVEENGESFIVLRKSKPVFKISPVATQGWETVVDFSEINPDGIPAKDVLKALKKISKS